MRVGNWDIYAGFLYYRLPEEWEDLDEAFERSRPCWNFMGVHLWHEITDEGHLLEIRFHRKKLTLRAKTEYTYLPAYWFVMSCGCSECRSLRKKLKLRKLLH